jgi:SfnB family sulfur acquisition oxidoreductase
MTVVEPQHTVIEVPATAEAAIAAARELAAEFAPGAAARDADRRLPFEQVQRLRESGLLAISIPREDGGPGLPPSVVAQTTAIIAAADPNIAQIPHSHYVYLGLVRLAALPPLRRRIFDSVLAGGQVANAQTERGGKTAADVATTLRRSGSEYRLDGTKFYCTGSLFADTLAVLAQLDEPFDGGEPGQYVAFIPADAPGVQIADDWDALGQRTTASGTITFDGVAVPADAIAPRALATSCPTGYGAVAQLLHAAIDTGIGRGALAAAAEFVKTKSRPWFEADVERAVDDPLLVQRFGELSVTVTAAEAALTAAGVQVDRAVAQPCAENAADASLAVAAAKILADRAATEVPSALFEVGGTRAAGVGNGLDHFLRNGRTHTLHDPVRWKYQHLGRALLRDELPPLHSAL